MTTKPLIAIGAPPFAMGREGPFERLESAGFAVTDIRPCTSLADDSIRRSLNQAWGFVAGNAPYLGEEFLRLAPELRVIGKMGAGYDNIDLSAATQRGVLVCNTPGVNTPAVADYTMGLILGLSRGIPMVDRDVRAGRWHKRKGLELGGKTLGLLGVGAIGLAVAQRARGFGVHLIGCDPHWPSEDAARLGIARVDVEALFLDSDILSLHCPLTEETAQVVNRRTLARMKPTALLINTARGELVEEGALAEALADQKLGGAALDAFSREPLGESPLRDLENVLLSSHTAWFTEESMSRMTDGIVDQLIEVLEGRMPGWPVNRDVLTQWTFELT